MGRQCGACKGTGELSGDTVRERMEKLKCRDCRNHHEGYMVRKRVWCEEAGLPYFGTMLCIPCLEKRLGRDLQIEDFTAAPINSTLEFGYKLGVGDRYLFQDSSRIVDAALALSEAVESGNGLVEAWSEMDRAVLAERTRRRKEERGAAAG